jgi:hypothetical protein
MRSMNLLTLTLSLPLLIAGCTSDKVALDELTETPLGASGGQALSAGGELTLTFAAGSLGAGSVVRIQTDRSATDATWVSPVFDLQVTPAVTAFPQPVTVSLRLATGLPGAALLHLAAAGPEAVAGSSYDPATGLLQAELTHFSRYVAQQSSACPAEAPGAEACPQDGLRCEYGQECCCGQCYPSLVYTCNGGRWGAYYTDACLIPACPDAGAGDSGTAGCPAEAPGGGACAEEGLRCEYGEECCCGQCYPSLVYTCNGGQWAGFNTDACLRPSCPDAG